ncbi:MAG: hypothetical protein FWC41_13595 [Firmicutes bacterium]|nr:hypothetical protein [Bacillota bacterium]
MKKLFFILFFGAIFFGVNAQYWNTTGNANTSPPTNYIGTSDAKPLIFKTNNTEHLRILLDGNIGIGTDQPLRKLHVKDGSIFISRKINEFTEPFLEFRALENEGGIWGSPSAGHLWSFHYLKEEIINKNYFSSGGVNISHTHLGAPHTTQSQLFLSGDGFVGINNTQPTSELDVDGTITAQNANILDKLTASSVGIGTDQPQALLHIDYRENSRKPNPSLLPLQLMRITAPASGYGLSVFGYFNAGDITIKQNDQAPFSIKGFASSLTFNPDGDINVNLPPTAKLDLLGSFKAQNINILDNLTAKSANITGKTQLMGYVGIGKAPTDYALDVNGSIKVSLINVTGPISFGSVIHGPEASFSLLRASKAEFFQKVDITGNASITGNLGIGVNYHNKYKLDVSGIIRAHELRVCVHQGCDFVFEEDYNLMGLEELEKFIKTNKHLPEVAPAAIMEAEGINVSEMSAKLLQKIEELTLYILQQEKKMLDLQHQINELKK